MAIKFNIDVADIESANRNYKIMRARHIAIYLCTRIALQSLTKIGRYFYRDHSTIVHARDKIAELRKIDEQMEMDIAELEAELWPQAHSNIGMGRAVGSSNPE